MTTHEVNLLFCGVGIGILLMAIVTLIQSGIDDRRDRKRLDAAEQLLAEAQRKADRAL